MEDPQEAGLDGLWKWLYAGRREPLEPMFQRLSRVRRGTRVWMTGRSWNKRSSKRTAVTSNPHQLTTSLGVFRTKAHNSALCGSISSFSCILKILSAKRKYYSLPPFCLVQKSRLGVAKILSASPAPADLTNTEVQAIGCHFVVVTI